MDKREYYIELYEEYKSLLTDKQRECFENYYFEDLSLNEIADNSKVSKSLVGKTINQVIQKLEEYESKLGLSSKNKKLKDIIDKLNDEDLKNKIEDILYK